MTLTPHILLIENIPSTREILKLIITMRLPMAQVTEADNYPDARQAIQERDWHAVVTDIGLPPGPRDHVWGTNIVRIAKEKGIPCIVVSDTKVVDKQLVADLLTKEEYRAKGFFSKVQLRKQPTRRKEFEDLLAGMILGTQRKILIAGGTSGEVKTILRSNGLADLAIEGEKLNRVLYQFLLNVLDNQPNRTVRHRDLNMIFDELGEDTATTPVRTAVHKLNATIGKWADLAEDQRCILPVKEEDDPRKRGYRLNTADVEWVLDEHMRSVAPKNRSVRGLTTRDAGAIENTPAPEEPEDDE